jgi:2-polyprenyl-6-methoxyphenol hydroxylase-like FAD-dependent oxidoreductase
VLAGDAGHFKDPSVAQGIRDGLRFGRLLGEAAAPLLDDPVRLDAALAAWEHDRDRDCLSTYHWANRESGVHAVQPLLREAALTFARTGGGLEFADVLSRQRTLEDVTAPPRSMVWLARALSRPGMDRRMILRQVAAEAAINRDSAIERRLDRFRPRRPHASERSGWTWPPPGPEAADSIPIGGSSELEQVVA